MTEQLDEPITFPKRTRRARLRLRLYMARWRIQRTWTQLVAPHKLHPDRLDGYDGEPPHFLRADLAKSAQDAVEHLLDEWGFTDPDDRDRRYVLEHMRPVDEVTRVWMVERRGPTKDADDEYATWYVVVVDWQPGAVEYWKWDE